LEAWSKRHLGDRKVGVVGNCRWGCGRIRPPALALASVVRRCSQNPLLRLKPSGVDADALSGAELTEVNEERWY